ncbi:hypothetical protein [Bradyrhizobium amphicarpaeae]|uniref:hypothetical protein n=1 Tax=Bradyrhizobium amphicarpaeae TaxID=1404768 RepID=UPI0011E4CC75|nr:hypothetical protein [Bradyrhizobium amphicarpaeae]
MTDIAVRRPGPGASWRRISDFTFLPKVLRDRRQCLVDDLLVDLVPQLRLSAGRSGGTPLMSIFLAAASRAAVLDFAVNFSSGRLNETCISPWT